MKTPLRILGTLAFTLGAGFALAQTIYTSTRSAPDQGLTLSSWGSGLIKESDDTAFEGTTSIRISARNFFQGGIFSFATPTDLSEAYKDKNNLLHMTVKVAGMTAPAAGSGRPFGPGPSGPGGGAPGVPMGNGGASGGGSSPGGVGRPGGSGGSDGGVPAPSKLRLVIQTSDGKHSECYIDISSSVPNPDGWMQIGIPLQAISGFDKTNKIVSSISISPDSVTTMYVGQIKILTDNTPVYGEVDRTEYNLALGDTVTFRALGLGGATALKYEWNFDSASGNGVDAEGAVVKRRFRKQGSFTVTLTVRDAYGLKKPYTTTVHVVVNP